MEACEVIVVVLGKLDELADKARPSPTTILKLEGGRVEESHPRTVRKLVQALEVEPAELLEEIYQR